MADHKQDQREKWTPGEFRVECVSDALQLAYRYLFTGEGPDEIDAAELATELEAVLAAARGEGQ